MPQRKIWTAEEDKVLKFLIQVRGLVKWSQISRVMQEQFKILGRNGKQCRQRYHNHLAQNIKNQQWSQQQQDILFKLQDEIGNKWALISSNLPGRTDNCVKNHFYSKLRKNLRKINKKINKNFKKQYRDIKTTTLYKIIETLQNKNKLGQIIQINEQTYQLCKKIKNQLRIYEDQIIKYNDLDQQLMYIKNIVEDFAIFDKEVKKTYKKENLKSSGKLSDVKSISANKSSNVVSSTKSIYDDESQFSNSNSEMFSQSSYRNVENRLNPTTISSSMKIFRSQKIESKQSIQTNKSQKTPILYNSANIKNKMMQMKEETRIMPQFVEEELNKQHNMSRQRSSSSNSQQNYKYLMGQESYMLNITSPPVLTLTASQIRQINQQNNQWLFGSQMKIDQQEQMIVKDFQKINLTIPKLGMDLF